MDSGRLPDDFDPDRWSIRAGCTVDEVLVALAEAQEGHVHVAQLRRLGVTADHLRSRRRSGALVAVGHGVHLVGRRTATPAGRRVAAVLGAGAGALLAGRSTLVGCGLLAEDPARPVDIVVPPERHLARAGVRRALVLPGERTTVHGVPSMTVPRALLHVAAEDDLPALDAAWRQAVYRRRLHLPAVLGVLEGHRGARGTAALREAHARRSRIIGATANEFEDRMRAILLEAGLPEPRCNVPLILEGVRLRPDLYVPERRLAIETDGRDGHEDPERRVDDALRDALYRRAGITLARYGWWAVTYERPRVLGDLLAFEAWWQVNGDSGGAAPAESPFTFARAA